MIETKLLLLALIIVTCSLIGFFLAKQYKDRLKELKDIRLAMNILETKMKLTKEPIAHIFEEISYKLETENTANLFLKASDHMEYTTASNAWEEALQTVKTSLNKEDLDMLRTFGKMIGKTDLEGQIKEIELTNILLEQQAEDARIKKQKNGRMYQSLGVISGLALCIILI